MYRSFWWFHLPSQIFPLPGGVSESCPWGSTPKELEGERVAATMYGCMCRRADYECILRNPNLKDSSLKGVEIRVSDPEGSIYSLLEIEGGKESLLLDSRGRISHGVQKERIKEEKEEKTREEWGVQRQGRKSKPILRSLRELRKKGQTPSTRLGWVLWLIFVYLA